MDNIRNYFGTFIDRRQSTARMCTSSDEIAIFDTLKLIVWSEKEHLVETV
jgi:hypothetical protein